MPEKICVRCEIAQPFSNFSKDRSRKDGHFPYCKTCKRKSHLESNLDEAKALERAQRYRETHRDVINGNEEYKAKARERHLKRQQSDTAYREANAQRAKTHYENRPIEESREVRQKWYADNREHAAHKARKLHLQKAYGLTLEQYADMVAAQNGVCAICFRAPRGKYKNLAIDHCHATGKIRGLLCYECNHGLGCFEDRTELFRSAIEYLIHHA